MAGFVVVAQSFVCRLEHYVYAVPLVVSVVQMEFLGTERAFQGDLVCWEGLGVARVKVTTIEGSWPMCFLFAIVFATASDVAVTWVNRALLRLDM